MQYIDGELSETLLVNAELTDLNNYYAIISEVQLLNGEIEEIEYVDNVYYLVDTLGNNVVDTNNNKIIEAV